MELLDNPSSLGVEYQLLFVLGVSLTAVTTCTTYLANEARVVGINAELHDWSKEAKRHDDLHHSDPNESHVEVSLVETAPGVHRETKGGGGGRDLESGAGCSGESLSSSRRRTSSGDLANSSREADLSPEILPRSGSGSLGYVTSYMYGGRELEESIEDLDLDLGGSEAAGSTGGSPSLFNWLIGRSTAGSYDTVATTEVRGLLPASEQCSS